MFPNKSLYFMSLGTVSISALPPGFPHTTALDKDASIPMLSLTLVLQSLVKQPQLLVPFPNQTDIEREAPFPELLLDIRGAFKF
jgi:hypothetical protein